MADKELFNGEVRTTIEDNENIPFRTPGQEGSRVISWLNFKVLLRSAFVWLGNINQTIDGIKTFIKSPIVPDPTTDLQAVNLRTLNNSVGSGNFNNIKLNPDSGVTLTEEGQIKWNDEFHTPEYYTGLGYTVTIGNTNYLVFYNDTGSIIPAFRAMHLVGLFDISGELYPTFEYADPRTWEKVQGTLGITMHPIPIASLGLLALSSQKIKGGDTSSLPVGSQLWIKAENIGDPALGLLTEVKPQFPNFSISVGANYNSSALDGELFVNITTSIDDIFHDAWDGAIMETFNFRVSSDGVTVLGTLENVDPLRNLTLKFSDNFYTLDTTTTPKTIALTPGTDELTVTNYVYIPIDTKVLTLSTSGFPTIEHCKIAKLEVQSAATVQSDGGARRNQNINDHIKTEDDNGHILHIAERVRQLNAQWDNGTEGSLTGTTANGYIQVTGGQVWQMHKQTVPSFSMPTNDILIVNDDTTAYRATDNLDTITQYSDGSSWSNDWSNIVIWGVANKTGEPSYVFCNLPSDGYNSEDNAIEDRNNYTDYTIPDKYKGVGFLIARFSIRISGGTITYNSGTGYQDLRGFVPNTTAGGGGGGGVTTLLALSDVFISDYTGKGGYVLKVNSGETGIEAVEDTGGGVTKSSNSITSSASITPIVGSDFNDYFVTALAVNTTINAPTGTANNGDELTIRITTSTTFQTVSWNAIYDQLYGFLPTEFYDSPTYITFKYNSTDTKWEMINLVDNPA